MLFLFQKLYDQSNGEITCLCLEVVGAYVSWIDIDLIANEKFVGYGSV